MSETVNHAASFPRLHQREYHTTDQLSPQCYIPDTGLTRTSTQVLGIVTIESKK
jgi:hypothetical protein